MILYSYAPRLFNICLITLQLRSKRFNICLISLQVTLLELFNSCLFWLDKVHTSLQYMSISILECSICSTGLGLLAEPYFNN